MAITKSAKKAHRQSLRRKLENDKRRKALSSALKGARVGGTSTSLSVNDRQKALAAAYKAIDKALKRGLLKKNTAARRKSKVAHLLKIS